MQDFVSILKEQTLACFLSFTIHYINAVDNHTMVVKCLASRGGLAPLRSIHRKSQPGIVTHYERIANIVAMHYNTLTVHVVS